MYEKLQLQEDRKGKLKIIETKSKLNIIDKGFIKKATRLINIKPEKIAEQDLGRFKKLSREWIKKYIIPNPY